MCRWCVQICPQQYTEPAITFDWNSFVQHCSRLLYHHYVICLYSIIPSITCICYRCWWTWSNCQIHVMFLRYGMNCQLVQRSTPSMTHNLLTQEIYCFDERINDTTRYLMDDLYIIYRAGFIRCRLIIVRQIV